MATKVKEALTKVRSGVNKNNLTIKEWYQSLPKVGQYAVGTAVAGLAFASIDACLIGTLTTTPDGSAAEKTNEAKIIPTKAANGIDWSDKKTYENFSRQNLDKLIEQYKPDIDKRASQHRDVILDELIRQRKVENNDPEQNIESISFMMAINKTELDNGQVELSVIPDNYQFNITDDKGNIDLVQYSLVKTTLNNGKDVSYAYKILTHSDGSKEASLIEVDITPSIDGLSVTSGNDLLFKFPGEVDSSNQLQITGDPVGYSPSSNQPSELIKEANVQLLGGIIMDMSINGEEPKEQKTDNSNSFLTGFKSSTPVEATETPIATPEKVVIAGSMAEQAGIPVGAELGEDGIYRLATPTGLVDVGKLENGAITAEAFLGQKIYNTAEEALQNKMPFELFMSGKAGDVCQLTAEPLPENVVTGKDVDVFVHNRNNAGYHELRWSADAQKYFDKHPEDLPIKFCGYVSTESPYQESQKNHIGKIYQIKRSDGSYVYLTLTYNKFVFDAENVDSKNIPWPSFISQDGIQNETMKSFMFTSEIRQDPQRINMLMGWINTNEPSPDMQHLAFNGGYMNIKAK